MVNLRGTRLSPPVDIIPVFLLETSVTSDTCHNQLRSIVQSVLLTC